MAGKKRFTIGEYALLLENLRMLTEFYSDGQDKIQITNLTYDSRLVTEGTLFICKGAAFKKEYLDMAVAKGAAGYVSETVYETEKKVPYLIVEDIRKAMPPLAEKFQNAPWKELTIVGIGGTKGKTTSAYYMKAVADDYMEASGGRESAVLSSMNVYDGKVRRVSHITTPEAVELQEHFRNAADAGITFMEMEVSSQALKYNRVDNMRLDVGIFLNISEDHISPAEHSDFEDYFSSKLRIFEISDTAVVNLDADFSERMLEASRVCKKVLTISTKRADADVYAYDIQKDGRETVFSVRTPEFEEEFRLTMSGLFNVENALSVIAASILLGIPKEYIRSGLYRANPGGRMEYFSTKDEKIAAVVDYAHNKLSFEKLFSSTRDEYPERDIVAVFGCPGNKAYIRRKGMGAVAGAYAKKVYLTADDPGFETVQEIAKDIGQYVEAENCPYVVIEDRGEAIRTAVAEAAEEEGRTIILVAGKGSESHQKVGNEYQEYKTDAVNVRECFAAYDQKHCEA